MAEVNPATLETGVSQETKEHPVSFFVRVLMITVMLKARFLEAWITVGIPKQDHAGCVFYVSLCYVQLYAMWFGNKIHLCSLLRIRTVCCHEYWISSSLALP